MSLPYHNSGDSDSNYSYICETYVIFMLKCHSLKPNISPICWSLSFKSTTCFCHLKPSLPTLLFNFQLFLALLFIPTIHGLNFMLPNMLVILHLRRAAIWFGGFSNYIFMFYFNANETWQH